MIRKSIFAQLAFVASVAKAFDSSAMQTTWQNTFEAVKSYANELDQQCSSLDFKELMTAKIDSLKCLISETSCPYSDHRGEIASSIASHELNAKQIAQEAANYAALLPIPEYVINDKVRAFEPTDQARYIIFSNGDYENLLLVNQELREREQNYVTKWRAELASRGLETPEAFKEENDELRFLMSHNFNFEETWAAMAYYQDYLLKVQAPLFSRYDEFKDQLEMGMVYGFKRDKQERPVIIYNLRKAIDQGLDMEKFLDVLDYLLAYTQYHALIPGKIETWNVIIDAKDVSVFEFPVASLGSMVKRIIADYKVRGNHMIAVNTHWLLAKAVNFVQPMLSPRVAGKTFLFTNDYHDHLDALIGKARLEQKFGGELPNVESNFFPPRYN